MTKTYVVNATPLTVARRRGAATWEAKTGTMIVELVNGQATRAFYPWLSRERDNAIAALNEGGMPAGRKYLQSTWVVVG